MSGAGAEPGTGDPRATAAGQPASGSRGMSLRTRLLLLQIAVTAVFLLIMGIVSTTLFAQHLRSQFNATILAESTRSPGDIIRGRPAASPPSRRPSARSPCSR